MRVQYVADDGSVFDTDIECIKHEKSPNIRLLKLVEDSCPHTFICIQGLEEDVISDDDVVKFVINQYPRIKEIMEV